MNGQQFTARLMDATGVSAPVRTLAELTFERELVRIIGDAANVIATHQQYDAVADDYYENPLLQSSATDDVKAALERWESAYEAAASAAFADWANPEPAYFELIYYASKE